MSQTLLSYNMALPSGRTLIPTLGNISTRFSYIQQSSGGAELDDIRQWQHNVMYHHFNYCKDTIIQVLQQTLLSHLLDVPGTNNYISGLFMSYLSVFSSIKLFLFTFLNQLQHSQTPSEINLIIILRWFIIFLYLGLEKRQGICFECHREK